MASMEEEEVTYATIEAFLIDSARYGDAEDVEMAIREKAKLDTGDEAGRTALHMAAANGHVGISKSLLEASAAVDPKNAEGSTPLHYACLNGQTEMVRLLLAAGASPAVVNQGGRTPVDECLGNEDLMAVIADAANASGSAGVAVEVEEVVGLDDGQTEAGGEGSGQAEKAPEGSSAGAVAEEMDKMTV